MIKFEDASELIFENTIPLGTESLLIEKSIGYVLAQDVISPINVSPFRNSAMDGFAVKVDWLVNCSRENPKTIPIYGPTSFAGNSASGEISEKHALKIMTGARVPDEFNAVVPFEETQYDDDEVSFFKPVSSGKHIREAGEDITRKQELFTAGKRLSQLDIGVLAMIGLRKVSVQRKPSILIVGTGDELSEPGEELRGDKIYDSNTYSILSLIEPLCESVERICRVPDKEENLQKALNSDHDVIITSGGVSVGERDLVVNMAEACRWERIFHKVRMKPGKPVYFAVRGRQLLFGLPGSPLAAAVTCLVFILPALKKMGGRTDYRLRPKPVTLDSTDKCKPGRKLIWPGFLTDNTGSQIVRFASRKSTAALTALTGTDGLIFQETTGSKPGDGPVKFVPWIQILH